MHDAHRVAPIREHPSQPGRQAEPPLGRSGGLCGAQQGWILRAQIRLLVVV
jgi:hypothetical protein